MEPEIRKVVTVTEEVKTEGGTPLKRPLRISAAMAVVKNPFAGRFEADLDVLSTDFSAALGPMLADLAAQNLAAKPESFGKAALVGTDGEVQHGSAVIHTLVFGDALRKVAGASGPVPSAEKRGAPGASIDLALRNAHDTGTLDGTDASHLFSFEARIPDAPFRDELVVVAVVADGGRPNPRAS